MSAWLVVPGMLVVGSLHMSVGGGGRGLTVHKRRLEGECLCSLVQQQYDDVCGLSNSRPCCGAA